MPKRTNLRKHKAADLLRLLKKGPDYSFTAFGFRGVVSGRLTREEIAAIQAEVETATRGWLQSWVTPHALALIPELKGEKP